MVALSTPALAAVLGSYVILCGLLLYFCVMADPNTSKMAYLAQVALPNKAWETASRVVGEERMSIVQSIMDLAMVFVYFFVVLGCWTIVFWYVYPWISSSSHVSNYHKICGYFIFLACFGSWRLANKSVPGFVTAQSFPLFDHYPYDNLMFLPRRRCETTGIIKIPRSKFDRFKYQHNIPRYDHYCGWVYNTIGEQNYRWFLLFLALHVIMCSYGSIVCIWLFQGEIRDKQLMEITFFDRATGESVQSNWFIVIQYLFTRRTPECAVLAVMFVMGIALGAFLGYHVYITSYNRTTNEDGKWSDIRKWYYTEQKKYNAAVKKGLVKPQSSSGDGTPSTGAVPEIQDGDVTCTGGGNGVTSQQQQGVKIPDFYDPGPLPQNIYDRGFIENWKEVIFPISLRKDALAHGGFSRPNRAPKQESEQEISKVPPPTTPSSKKD